MEIAWIIFLCFCGYLMTIVISLVFLDTYPGWKIKRVELHALAILLIFVWPIVLPVILFLWCYSVCCDKKKEEEGVDYVGI